MSIIASSRSNDPTANIPTLATICDRIAADPSLSDRRRQDVTSALRTFSKALGANLEELPAHPGFLRQKVQGFTAAMGGLAEGRWRNTLSLARFALKHAGLAHIPGRYQTPMAPAWAELYAQVTDRRAREGLSRFLRYCTANAIAPEQVNDTVQEDFRQALEEASLVNNAREVHRRACLLWNKTADAVATWPQQRLTVPSYKYTYAVPWSRFPASLKVEVDAYLDRLTNDDPVEDYGFRPLRPRSIRTRASQIHNVVSALVQRGRDPQTITSLADLVAVDAVKDALRFFLQRENGGARKHAYDLACLLSAIARHVVRVDFDHQDQLKAICRRLKPRSGMTEKNKTRLRQFDDAANLQALLTLPRKLLKLASRISPPDKAAALLVQTAVMIEILLMVPIRVGNLSSLALDRHIVRTRRGVMHLVIPGDEVKNDFDIEAILPDETVALLTLYLDRYRPILLDGPSPWLFPGQIAGKAKHIATVQWQLTRTLKRQGGLVMNAHLFRHLAAKLQLGDLPGSYGLVRLITGHKSVETTTRFYCGAETPAAFHRFDELILRLRNHPAPTPKRRRAVR